MKPKSKTPKTKSQKPKKRFKIPKIGTNKKSRWLVILIILLALFVLVGIGISKVFFKDNGSDAKTKENVRTEQKKAVEKSEKVKQTALDPSIENHLGTDFIKILRSENFLIKYKTTIVYNNQPFEAETTYATSGSSISLVSKDWQTIVRDGKVNMLNHTDKTIIRWDVGHSSKELKRIDTEGLVFIDSKEENGLVCEEYKTASSYLKLYFRDKVLVKMVTIINGLDTVMDIVEVSREVPDSLFVVPQDYQISDL